MDPNQNDQTNQTPTMPVDDNPGQNPVSMPQPEPTMPPMPEPVSMPDPEPTPTPAPVSDVGQGPVEEITPPPPMVEDQPQNEQPALGTNQGSTGDTNPVV
jgi:hypothetical protein